MKKKILTIILATFGAGIAGMNAMDMRTPKVHCDSDTVRINEIIAELVAMPSASLGDRIAFVAEKFVEAGEDDFFSTDSIGELRINVETFTPLSLINNAVALAKTSQLPGSPGWHAFVGEFEYITCRKGEDAGFSSIMFHTSDWIGDNALRGNLREITEDFEGVVDRTKSLDEMTRNRKKYAALADSARFEKVRMTEMGFRTHRVPALKRDHIKKKEVAGDLQNGDIIILVPYHDGVDYYDIGVIAMEAGEPYLVHLHPQKRIVVKESEPLARYMQLMAKHFQGFRLIRVK